MKKGEFKTASGHTAVIVQCRQINMKFVWGGYIECPVTKTLHIVQCRQINMKFVWGGYIECPVTKTLHIIRWDNNGLCPVNPEYDLKL